jgi:MFS family permease
MGFQFQSVASVSPFLVEEFGIDYTMIGLLIGLYLLPGIVVALPGGFLGRRYGEKRLVLLGFALMTLGGWVSGAGDPYGMLVAGRAITGIGVVLQFVLMTKMLTDWFGGRNLVLAMALYLNGWPIGIGIALVTQVELAAESSWQAVFLATGALSAVAFVVIAVLYRAPPTGDGAPAGAADGAADGAASPAPTASRLSRREILLVSLAGILWTLTNAGWVVVVSFAPGFMETQGVVLTEAAAITSLATWLAIIGVPLGGFLAVRWGRPDLFIVVCTLAGALAILALPLASTYVLSFVVIGLIMFIPASIIAALPIEVLRPENRATGLGLFYTWWYVGLAGLPPLAGWSYDYTGAAAAPMYYAALLMIASLGALALFRMFQARPNSH